MRGREGGDGEDDEKKWFVQKYIRIKVRSKVSSASQSSMPY